LAQALGYQKANPQKPQGTNVLAMRSNGARTSASGGAGGRSGAPTFADLAAMDNAEFEKMTAGDNWQKFAG